eukprot:GILK01003969.1.p1 GENE.GILK01003969.1~~GILK01003969.1.p1  ORF type:complete len:306 (-),score=47.56 GILK01003969.1:190-1065(-)
MASNQTDFSDEDTQDSSFSSPFATPFRTSYENNLNALDQEDSSDPEWASERQESSNNQNLSPPRPASKPRTRGITLEQIPTWEEQGPEIVSNARSSTDASPLYGFDAELNRKVSIYQGDATKLQLDAIVNAANRSLLGGGGIDGAIHAAAGGGLYKECKKLGGCNTGDAKITQGHHLPALHVIHTVGPIGENPSALRSCYNRSMEVAVENNVRSLAFCCISTGIYGYPIDKATHIALETIRRWLEKDDNRHKVDRIVFCIFMNHDLDVYHSLMPRYFPLSQRESPPSNQES